MCFFLRIFVWLRSMAQTLITGFMHTGNATGYTGASVPIPMPLPSFSSTPKFYFRSPFQQTQWRQRIVHTRTFKVYEYGNRTPELMVEEVDASGHPRVRSLGTVPFWNHGRVRDRNGLLIVDKWNQSAQLASYWRRHFDLPEKISTLTTTTIRMICPSQLR